MQRQRRKGTYDGLGRLAQVIEPRPAGGEYTTSYTYNLLGKLTQVSMPRDGTTQTRTFTYDATTQSRLLTATNPENGTVSYTYNLDGTVATKTDAKNIRTEFSYDAYKRPTEMRKLTLSGGVWTEDRCQRVTYDYTLGGVTTRYLQKVSWGWNASNQPCNNTAGAFEEQYTYLTNGAIASKSLIVIRLIGGQLRSAQLQASWTYNNEGQPTQLTYPQRSEGAGPITTQARYTYDTMGRSSGVDWRANAGANPPWSPIISSVTYNAFGAVTGFNHLGQTETRQYNDLGQLTRITQGTAIDIEYRFSATANDGKITSQKNWRTGEDVTYQYDQLERLISASTTAGPQSWGLSWSYDGFGNRLAQTVTQGSGPAHSVLVNASTNRISSAGFSYDPNGNLTAMPQTGGGTLNLTYDLSNRVTNLAHNGWTEDYLYSPDNRRIWRSAGQTFCGASIDDDQGLSWNPGTGVQSQYILYSPAGQKLGVYCLSFSPSGQYNAWTASEENVYWGSRLVAKRIGVGAMGHFITDRLHSKGDGSAFYPYGESKTGAAGDDREQFATYTRDQTSGLDYADQRWYSSRLGRFTSSDPYERSASPEQSATWNRFSYVISDPLNLYDPEGLIQYCPHGALPNNAGCKKPPPPIPLPGGPTVPGGPIGPHQPPLEVPPPDDPAPIDPLIPYKECLESVRWDTRDHTFRVDRSVPQILRPSLPSAAGVGITSLIKARDQFRESLLGTSYDYGLRALYVGAASTIKSLGTATVLTFSGVVADIVLGEIVANTINGLRFAVNDMAVFLPTLQAVHDRCAHLKP